MPDVDTDPTPASPSRHSGLDPESSFYSTTFAGSHLCLGGKELRNVLTVVVTTAILFQSEAAMSQTADPSAAPVATPPTKPLTTCEALARDWRNVEVDLAKSNAEDIGDNSAPRATMRAIRDGNSLEVAAITLSLMRDNKCSLPKRPPSHVTYMIPAIECATEQLKGNYKAPQCDTATWKSIGQ
jgi:hypothetical protein